MAAEGQQIRNLVHAFENRNQVVLEIQLVHRIRGRNVGDIVVLDFILGDAVTHLQQIAKRDAVDLLVARVPHGLVAPARELDAEDRPVRRHHVAADVLLLRHPVHAVLLVEQVHPVVVGQLRARERDVNQLQAAVPQLRRVLRDRRRQLRRHHAHQRRQRQRREHAVAVNRLFATVLFVHDPGDTVAVALEAHDRRLEQNAVARAPDGGRHALVQHADPFARIHVLREVSGRIRLDAERPQNDVFQIQLRNALRLLRRDLGRRQSPYAGGIDPEAQVVQRAAEIPDAPLLERMLLLRRRERRLERGDQVIEDDARRQERADAGQHLEHLERIDVLLAAQEHARAARQDQRVVAEERLDRFVNRAALVGLANMKRMRPVIDRVLPDGDRLSHAADRAVALEHGDRIPELRQPPGRRHAGRTGAEHDDLHILHILHGARQIRSATTK